MCKSLFFSAATPCAQLTASDASFDDCYRLLVVTLVANASNRSATTTAALHMSDHPRSWSGWIGEVIPGCHTGVQSLMRDDLCLAEMIARPGLRCRLRRSATTTSPEFDTVSVCVCVCMQKGCPARQTGSRRSESYLDRNNNIIITINKVGKHNRVAD